MEYRYYKNGNIHIRFDSDIDNVEDNYSYADMICIIYNSMLDCVEYENYDSYFSVISIINHANQKTYDYVIQYSDIENFFSGKWVILYGRDEHAYIKIPYYTGTDTCITDDGKKFRYYKLEKIPNKEFMAEMTMHGCMFKTVSPQYAPEIKQCSMFVPYGKRIEFM